MAGLNADSFERALRKFKQNLSPSLVRKFSICKLEDVKQTIRDIQDQQGKAGRLRNMRRLDEFIEAMNQFGGVIDVFVNANQFVCFVWGPIKFLLGIAKTHLDSFDKLLDVYGQIGAAIPGLLQHRATFENHPTLATVLEDYYSDILRFHQEALSVFERPKWKMMFHATWKTFETKFNPILQSLTMRRELLEAEKSSATLYEVRKVREDIETMCQEQRRLASATEKEKHKLRVSEVRSKLQAVDYYFDQQIHTEDRYSKASGKWIFEEPRFRSWFDADSPGHGVLYVNGIPGAGKTTLMSHVIEELLQQASISHRQTCSTYFFFKHDQPEKNTHNSLLRATLDQLINHDSAVSDLFIEEAAKLADVNFRSTASLETLVKRGFECYHTSYLILDGLDECSKGETEKSVQWLLSLTKGGLDASTNRLRIIFAGQRDGILDRLLDSQPSISLEYLDAHAEDIRQYCLEFCERIQEKFKDSSLKQTIIELVTEGAKGMFLYAHVVLENLLHQTRLTQLRRELQPGIFPEEIERAYERVVVRVLEQASKAERNDAQKVLGLVIGAKRILAWREIQAFYCIEPATGAVSLDERLLVSCKQLCGSLLDVHQVDGNPGSPDNVVQIVHETARHFLIMRKVINVSLENARLSLFCTQYLTSEPFQPGIGGRQIRSHAGNGSYSLQDYAVQFWFQHLLECVGSQSQWESTLGPTPVDSARTFLMSYGISDAFLTSLENPSHTETVKAIQRLPSDSRERNSCLNIELRTTVIRREIEELQRDPESTEDRNLPRGLCGTRITYKCSKPWCEYFRSGFNTSEEQKRHISRHELPFYCSEDCFASGLGFDSASKLESHRRNYHSEKTDQIRFPKLKSRIKSSLCSAARQGDLATVIELLDAGADIDQTSRNHGGCSPLQLAASEGHFEIIRVLISRGAHINFQGQHKYDSQTALHRAAGSGHLEIVNLLLSQDTIFPDLKDVNDKTPFLCAISENRLDVVQLMLDCKIVNVDLKSAQGGPLWWACWNGNTNLVQYLLQKGFDKVDDVSTLLELLINNHEKDSTQEILEILLSAGNLEITDQSRVSAALECRSIPLTRKVLSHPKLDIGLSVLKAVSRRVRKLGSQEMDILIRKRLRQRADIESAWSVDYESKVTRRLDIDFVRTVAVEGFHDAHCVCFSRDGQYIATTSDNSARIYNVGTGEELCALHHEREKGKNLEFSTTTPRSICFSPDGKYLVTGGDDGLVRVWDIQSRTIRKLFKGYKATILAVDFACDSHTVASGCVDGTVRLRNVDADSYNRTYRIEHSFATSVKFSPTMEWVAAGFREGGVRIWNISTGYLITQLQDDFPIRDIQFLPDGRLISASRAVRLWQIKPDGNIPTECLSMNGHKEPVTSVSCTPDAAWIISASHDGCVRFWDTLTGTSQLELRCKKFESIYDVACSPVGGLVAVAFRDGLTQLWSYKRVPVAPHLL